MNKNIITIEWHSLVKDVIRNIWIVVLAAIIGYMGMFIASKSVYKPEYTSSAMIVVNSGTNTSNSYSSYTVSSEMASVLTNIFSQPAMKAKAAAFAQKDSFNGSVSASVLSSTNFIEIRVTSDDPQNSYELLSAILEVYPEISQNIFENAKISVLRLPSMPTKPSNSSSYNNQEIVIGACVTVSLFAIIALSVVRDTVKNEASFENKIDAKLLGCIAHEKKHMSLKERLKRKKKGLLIGSNTYISLNFVESFNKIAAKIEYNKRENGDMVYAISSVTENEGKSTCAANIAIALANRGHKVILIDFDCKKPALYKIFNQSYNENREIANLLNGKIQENDFKFKKVGKKNLFLALNTKPYPEYHKWFENGAAEEFVEAMKNHADFIIIDTAPFSVDSSVTNVMRFSDETLLVIRTDCVTATAINDSVSVVQKVSKSFMGCVLNDVYPKVAPFSFSGNDQSVQYGHYSKTGKYGKYGRYGRYGRYGKY